MELKKVERVIKDFSDFIDDPHGLKLPVLTTHEFSPRTDEIKKIKEGIEKSEMSKRVLLGDTSYIVGPTIAASPHTPISVEDEAGNRVPLHYVMWWIKEKGDDLYPSDFSDLANLSPDGQRQVLEALGSSTYQTIKMMKQADQEISIYGVTGHAPVSDQVETGLNRGPQSNENGHFHIAALTPEILQKHMELKSVDAADVLKHISPFNNIFFETTKDAVVRRLERGYGGILNVQAFVDHSNHSEFGRISFFEGYKLTFKEAVVFGDAMKVLTKFISEAQGIYAKIIDLYGDYYQHLADPQEKDRISEQCVSVLLSFGCSQEEAIQLQRQFFSLSPTYSQLRSWIEVKNGSESDPNRKSLQEMFIRYQKHREQLQDPQKREKLRQRLIQNHYLSGEETEIILTLIEDKLKDSKSGELADFTMPKKLSLGYSFDYKLGDDQLNVRSITLATRFSKKNIFEDMVGYMLVREPQNI